MGEDGRAWTPGCGRTRLKNPGPRTIGDAKCLGCPKFDKATRKPLELSPSEWADVRLVMLSLRLGVPASVLEREGWGRMRELLPLYESATVARLARG